MKRNKTKLPAEAFDRTPRYTITVTDETCWLTRHDLKGKPASTYPVNLADLGAAFNAFEASTGMLPDGVLFWQRTAQSERVAIWLPPARRKIAWRSGKRVQRLNVPLPGFVFAGAGTQYSIFAAMKRPAKQSNAIYIAPLPNVHGDGHICAGNVDFPRCSLDTIHAAADLFFASEFNHDLSSGKLASLARNGAPTKEDSLLNIYRSLDGAKRFPEQRLLVWHRGLADLLGAQWQPSALAETPAYDFAGAAGDIDEMGDVMEDEA